MVIITVLIILLRNISSPRKKTKEQKHYIKCDPLFNKKKTGVSVKSQKIKSKEIHEPILGTIRKRNIFNTFDKITYKPPIFIYLKIV